MLHIEFLEDVRRTVAAYRPAGVYLVANASEIFEVSTRGAGSIQPLFGFVPGFSKDLIRSDSCFDSWINFSASVIKRAVFLLSSSILHRSKADSRSCCDFGITCVLVSSMNGLRCESSDLHKRPTPQNGGGGGMCKGNSWSLALGWTIATPNSALLTKTGELVDSPAA